jgi:hypothetical protein
MDKNNKVVHDNSQSPFCKHELKHYHPKLPFELSFFCYRYKHGNSTNEKVEKKWIRRRKQPPSVIELFVKF